MDRLAGQNNARNPEGGTEVGIEDSYEEGFQDGDGSAPSSKVGSADLTEIVNEAKGYLAG